MFRKRIIKPVFLIGMPRSGTTAISEAISLHEEFGWISNYVAKFPQWPWLSFFNRICFIPRLGLYIRGKKPQNKSSFLRKYFPYPAETYLIWEKYLGKKFRNDYLIGKSATKEEKEKLIKYLLKLLKWQGKKRLFVKFTGPPRIHFLISIFPDAFFIHIIRDPRAVVSSLLRVDFWKRKGGLERPWWNNGLTQEDIDEWHSYRKSPIALAAIQWKRIVETTWMEKDLIPEKRFIEIRYEDFVADPHYYLTQVFKKLQLDDSKVAHKYISSLGKLKNMNYKFKQYLTNDDIKIIETITKKTAKRAGYVFEIS